MGPEFFFNDGGYQSPKASFHKQTAEGQLTLLLAPTPDTGNSKTVDEFEKYLVEK